MRIKALSLDLDGTLVSREYVDYFWLELVPKLYAERWHIDLKEAKQRVMEAYEEVGPRDIRWYRPRYWFRRFGLDEAALKWAIEEAGKLVRPYEDAIEFLRIVRGKVRLLLCTSASREFIDLVFRKLPAFGRSFSRIFSSVSDFNMPGKPPEFYLKVLEEVGIESQNLVHVGDDEEADYRNPMQVGVRAYLINREGGKRGLQSLLELLDELNIA